MKNKTISGFALMEVLVSMAIISCSLFPILFFQIQHLKESRNTLYKAIAFNQINNFIEMNKPGNHDFNYVVSAIWNKENKSLLPAAYGFMQYLSQGRCQVCLHWFYIESHYLKIIYAC